MILSLENISLSFPASGEELPILHNVSLSLPEGKSVAIVGPSGSGKTSLLMICAGLLKPDSGRILFRGTDISGYSEDGLSTLRRDNMGVVFQNFHLIPTMTALENVAIPLELAGEKDARERAKGALDNVRLSHRLSHYPAQLSGGEQQRVAIARAISVRPSLILADEPTGNLDQETGKIIMTYLFDQVASGGATLALITHDPALAQACDLQIHIQDGKVSGA